MTREAKSIFMSALLTGLAAVGWSANSTHTVWARAEAKAKIGKRVRYQNGHEEGFLQWGPIKINGKNTLLKPVGRSLAVGSMGTVTGIVKDGKRGYEVVIDWDPDSKTNEIWQSYLHKYDYDKVVEFPASGDPKKN
jgi:hypothetical protein